MKSIKITDKCNGCGLCVLDCKYIKEDDAGYASVVKNTFIKDKDSNEIDRVINNCPQKAIEIIDVSKTNKKGKEGLKELILTLKSKRDKFNVKRVTSEEVKFSVGDYYIDIPYSDKEYIRNYNSERQAKEAVREEFCRLCYSENIYRPLLKKIFVEYKINYLKPYYNFDNITETIYFKYNSEIKELLSGIYNEIEEIGYKKNCIPKEWKEFNVYYKEDDFILRSLKKFDDKSNCSGIIKDFKERGEYTSLKWYLDRVDYDYDEFCEGETLFGNIKYKKKWYFSGLNDEIREFFDDLKQSIDSKSYDISMVSEGEVNDVLGTFEKDVKKELSKKIDYLEELINNKQFGISNDVEIYNSKKERTE